MTTDLSAAASANAAKISVSAAQAVAADPTGVLADFQTHAASARMSSNVSFEKVLAYNETGELLHSRDLHVHWAGGDKEAGLAKFSRGDWSKRREAFEDLWNDGRTALYGALNTGGIGTRGQYGPVCVVISDPTDGATGLGIFPGDSAQTYTDAAATVDSKTAHAQVGAWASRSNIAVLQRGTEALRTVEADWPWLICHVDRYLEVVRTGPAPIGLVTAVRFERGEYRRLRSLRAKRVIGAAMTKEDEAAADTFNIIQGWRSTLGIEIEQV